MNERVSILMNALPQYGEILIGIGSIAVDNEEDLLENIIARERLKKYLIEDAIKHKNLMSVSKSYEFRKIIYDYSGKVVSVGIMSNKKNDEKVVDMLLWGFFVKKIWPIIVNKYMDYIVSSVDMVIIPIKIKKNTVNSIYGENSELFFGEFKEFLLFNYIVISEAKYNQEGDLLLKLMIPCTENGNNKM